jgi:hypothetical protein
VRVCSMRQTSSRNAVDMLLPGEPRSEAVEAMRDVSSPGEEDESSAGAAPIQNFKLNSLFDGHSGQSHV